MFGSNSTSPVDDLLDIAYQCFGVELLRRPYPMVGF
jgi:hypothetical protein